MLKPKREWYSSEFDFTEAERDYYRDALAIAVEALADIEKLSNDASMYGIAQLAEQALLTIKGSQS